MEFFTKKKNLRKIIIAFVILILFNFIVPTYSRADVGGALSAPVVALVATIFDALNGLMANLMISSDSEYGDGGFMGLGSLLTVYPDAHEGVPIIDLNGASRGPWRNVPKQYITNNPYDPSLPTVIILNEDINGDYGVPILRYTPGLIFSGKVKSLDVNFFTTEELDPNSAENKKSVVAHLRGIVSSWYLALRNISIVGLLSVLIYLGIRLIVTSSNAEKAKYKQNILDWLVAMCLLFFLHYIMSFTMLMVNSITTMIVGEDYSGNEINVVILDSHYDDVSSAKNKINTIPDVPVDGSAECKYATSLMGAARIQVEYNEGSKKWGYLLLYIALTIYTIIFTVTYLKRVINMVFLTIIAPLVALTYPLDKAGDTKAQAFSFWLKEYVYNALMQPLHLLLYMILVGSAMSLAASNMLYAIVALAFILPAEKLVKKMFNFRNDATGSPLGGFAGGMMAKTLLDKAGTGGKRSAQSGGQNGRVRTANVPRQRDPSAPKGASALAGDNTLLAGTGQPSLSSRSTTNAQMQNAQAATSTGRQGTQAMPAGQNASASQQVTGSELNPDAIDMAEQLPDAVIVPNGSDGQQEQGSGAFEDAPPVDPNTAELIRQQHELLENPDLTDEQRAEAQEELDYLEGNTRAGAQQDIERPTNANADELIRKQRELLDNPDLSDEERSNIEDTIAYLRRKYRKRSECCSS